MAVGTILIAAAVWSSMGTKGGSQPEVPIPNTERTIERKVEPTKRTEATRLAPKEDSPVQQPQNLPPGTPLFRDVDNLSYRQDFTPY